MGDKHSLVEGQVLLGKYRVERKLGEGGMAVVYQASSIGVAGFERPVVLKVIKPQLAETPGMLDSFVREASVGAALDHPNIVHVFDLGEADGVLYMVLEYVQGRDLAALTHRARKARRVLGPELVAYFCIDILKALECSHNYIDPKGKPSPIIHRDISPQNILISRKGDVKLADFGMARALGSSRHTAEGVVKGKLSYMSPEQSRGKEVDARSDLFSLGVVMWETLTGRRLFLGKNPIETVRRLRACAVPPLAKVAPHVPAPLASVVHQVIQADPVDRYQTATDFRKSLRSYLRGARPIDASALADLIETYFPAQKDTRQTAVPELAFADEGDEQDQTETSESTPPEPSAEAQPEEEEAADGTGAPGTLLMFGEQAEALQEAFREAQAAAKERVNDAMETHVDDGGAEIREMDETHIDDDSTEAKTVALEADEVAAHQAAVREVKAAREKADKLADTVKSPDSTDKLADTVKSPEEQKQKAPPATLIVQPGMGIPTPGGLPAVQHPTPQPSATPSAVQPVQQPTPQSVPGVTPQGVSGPYPQQVGQGTPYPGGQAVQPEEEGGIPKPVLLSLVLGIPLGAVVGFLVYWLLTN